MTILKNVLLEKPGDEEKGFLPPEVVEDSLLVKENVVNEQLPPAVVSVVARRQRRSAVATLCLTGLVLVVLGIAITSGVYVYRILTRPTFSGWCAVPYYQEQVEQLEEPAALSQTGGSKRWYGSFREHVDVTDNLETIDVPEFDLSARATVMHDFAENITAIVDQQRGRCFLLPLDRNVIAPPRSYVDLLLKLLDGSYLPKLHVIRQLYQVQQPAVKEPELAERHGYYVWLACHRYQTFHLRRVEQKRAKRSLEDYELTRYVLSGGLSELPVVMVQE